jgi:hypothetical protein
VPLTFAENAHAFLAKALAFAKNDHAFVANAFPLLAKAHNTPVHRLAEALRRGERKA